MKSVLKLAIVFCGLLFSNTISAQKTGVVDTEYILNKLPQYIDADNRLKAQIATWTEELITKQGEYERKKAAFESEKVLLIGDQLKLREKEVLDLEKDIRNTQSLRFGSNGEIEKLRANMVTPFIDQIWNAVKTVSDKNGLGIVIDKASNINVIYLQKRFDYTDKVLDVLLKDTTSKSNSRNKK